MMDENTNPQAAGDAPAQAPQPRGVGILRIEDDGTGSGINITLFTGVVGEAGDEAAPYTVNSPAHVLVAGIRTLWPALEQSIGMLRVSGRLNSFDGSHDKVTPEDVSGGVSDARQDQIDAQPRIVLPGED